ncbi:hypothetical protein VpasPP24_105 [Vibrio phage Vpas_PP24]|nr:hypothetical protein VpasPP24_105 [Vibrio phage Vpas_PP24]
MANLLQTKDDTVSSLVVKLVVLLMVILVVGVGSAVVSTTFTTERELMLLKQQFEQSNDNRAEDMKELTTELSNVVYDLSQVSNNLASLSGTLYTKDAAQKEARSVDSRIGQLWANQRVLARAINAQTGDNVDLERPAEPEHR